MLIYLKYKKKETENLTGFDLAKEITANDNEINIVESKEIYFSKYNGKRKVIHLIPKHYAGHDNFSLAVCSYLAGFSLCDINQEQSIKLITKITSSLDYLSKSPLIAIIISLTTNTVGDAKLGLFALILLTIYQYFVHQLHTSTVHILEEQLEKIKEPLPKESLIEIMEKLSGLTKTAFITSLILILREILIILEM